MTLLEWMLLITNLLHLIRSWTHHLTPNSKVTIKDTDDGVQGYAGQSNITDHFQIILMERDSFIVGARNVAHNLSLRTLRESLDYRISWEPQPWDHQNCLHKKKSVDECQNYIRVIVRRQDNTLYICGTNAFKPRCRTYTPHPTPMMHTAEERGNGRCPFDPSHNTTYIYAGGHLYAGTAVDIMGQRYLIYRDDNIMLKADTHLLNHPNFVKSIEYGDKVYFFFREDAVENTNCAKTVFSRVARVCKSDKGGFIILNEMFTSFFKSRLNCSVPGDYPFEFNELQSVTDLGRGNCMPTSHRGNITDMVYAVFTTPMNSITGSAICAFKFSDIIQSFRGKFKGQRKPHHNWLSVPETDTPTPHPSLCTEDSTTLPEQTLTFTMEHPLMDDSIPASGGAPIFLITGVNYRFTAVAVDWQVLAAANRSYDVLFIGTDNGRVLKAVKGWDSRIEYNLIEDIEVFADGRPITQLHMHRKLYTVEEDKLINVSDNQLVNVSDNQQHNVGHKRQMNISGNNHTVNANHSKQSVNVNHSNQSVNATKVRQKMILVAKLIVVSHNDIVSIPLHRCHTKKSCTECVGLQDPYCSWTEDGKCANTNIGLQDIHIDGARSLCKEKLCEASQYGPNCEFPCNCKDDDPCNMTTGHCPSGCVAGYSGSPCTASTPPASPVTRLDHIIPPVLVAIAAVITVVVFIRYKKKHRKRDECLKDVSTDGEDVSSKVVDDSTKAGILVKEPSSKKKNRIKQRFAGNACPNDPTRSDNINNDKLSPSDPAKSGRFTDHASPSDTISGSFENASCPKMEARAIPQTPVV